jgi:ribulose 1,5-bisphosphate synthetase/thiazole synthase
MPTTFYGTFVVALLFTGAFGDANLPHVRYAILGAGPGGLQLAHYLDSAGRDYVVFENNQGPGS